MSMDDVERLAFRCGARLGIVWATKRAAAAIDGDSVERATDDLWRLHQGPDVEKINQLLTLEKP